MNTLKNGFLTLLVSFLFICSNNAYAVCGVDEFAFSSCSSGTMTGGESGCVVLHTAMSYIAANDSTTVTSVNAEDNGLGSVTLNLNNGHSCLFTQDTTPYSVVCANDAPNNFVVHSAGYTCPSDIGAVPGADSGQTQCSDGHWINSGKGDTCDSSNTCPALVGTSFTLSNSEASAPQGNDKGCEFQAYYHTYSITGGVTTNGALVYYCFTGNGSSDQGQEPPVEWGTGSAYLPIPAVGNINSTSAATCPSGSYTSLPRQCNSANADGSVNDGDCTDPSPPYTFAPPTTLTPDPITDPVSTPTPPTVPVVPPPGDTTPPPPTVPTSPGSGSSPAPPSDGSGSWGAFPAIPTGGFYTRHYTSLQDVYSSFQTALNSSQFSAFLQEFQMPTGAGSYPTWTIDLTSFMGQNWGVYPVSIPDYVWTVVKAGIMITALVMCRAIIFGG